MPKGHWIVCVSVRDGARYPEYLAAARPAFEKYAARFLVRGGPFEAKEGVSRERNVVVEFPDPETAHAWNIKLRRPSGTPLLTPISLL